MCCTKDNSPVLYSLGPANNVWVIGSIHSDIDRLIGLHDELLGKFMPGDKVVYTGNYIGYGFAPRETLEELLTFRRLIMSIPGVSADDIVYLRGAQEEILSKVLQLPFAPNPEKVYMWMLGNGLSSTLEGFDLDRHDGLYAAREGVMGLCRWTGKLRTALRSINGYDRFMNVLKRAAYTPTENEAHPMLFVNAGINLNQSLEDQGDAFWWATKNFKDIHVPYKPFSRIIRGYDPEHEGVYVNGVTATIDGGCGFGGTLACAGFDRSSEVVDLFEV